MEKSEFIPTIAPIVKAENKKNSLMLTMTTKWSNTSTD